MKPQLGSLLKLALVKCFLFSSEVFAATFCIFYLDDLVETHNGFSVALHTVEKYNTSHPSGCL